MSDLSEAEITRLAAQVDDELIEVFKSTERFGPDLKGGKGKTKQLPSLPKQQQAIEAASGEKLESFWEKFMRHARRDLCKPGGKMHDVWEKYRDLDSRTAVASIHPLLLGMGIAEHSALLMVAPVAVFLITWLLNVSKEAICEDC
jgi:hypothetical protein